MCFYYKPTTTASTTTTTTNQNNDDDDNDENMSMDDIHYAVPFQIFIEKKQNRPE